MRWGGSQKGMTHARPQFGVPDSLQAYLKVSYFICWDGGSGG